MENMTLHYQYHGGNKHSSSNSDFSSYLQNLDGNSVEHSCFHKKYLIKASCHLLLLESSADVSITIHSLITQLPSHSSGYTCHDYFSQLRETPSPLPPHHLLYFSSRPFIGFPNSSANADCSINTAG